MRCVVGIDAGGTKTVGLLADEAGRILDEARGGGANLHVHGELGVEKVFDAVLDPLVSKHPVHAVCLGIAGVDRPHDEAVIRGILRRLGHRERARVTNDAIVALVAGSPTRTGVVVLAGTGAICYGIDAEGRTARSSGEGWLLSDEGSGYWLGREALRAAVRDADGRGPATALREAVFGALGVDSVARLIPVVYEKPMARHEIAALAGLVEQAAAAGDRVADQLLDAAALELALGARSVARQLGFDGGEFPVVLAGGVFKASPGLAARLGARLELPHARLIPLTVEPAVGAVALAIDLLPRS